MEGPKIGLLPLGACHQIKVQIGVYPIEEKMEIVACYDSNTCLKVKILILVGVLRGNYQEIH